MTKEEVIKEAYGEHWEEVKDYVDDFGWLAISKHEDRFDNIEDDIEMIDYFDYELEISFSRPKSLEFWVDIKEYEGLYEASDLGKIKSLSKEVSNGNGRFTKKDRILKPHVNKDGYNTVNLYKDGKKTLFKCYRLVLSSFKENVENKKTINHRNSVRTDDLLINLDWATHSENNQHAFDYGFKKPMKGSECWLYNINPNSHPSAKEVIDVSTGKIYGSLKTACYELGIKYSHMLSKISLAGKGKNDTSLMYLSELNELPKTIIIKIGNREFNFIANTTNYICEDCGKLARKGSMYCDPCNKFNSI